MTRAGARPVLSLFAGLALMVAAWTAVTPLAQAPDEPAHYIKALAAGRGHAHGAPPDLKSVNGLIAAVKRRPATRSHEAQVHALRFVTQASGAFALPNGLAPEIGCFNNLLMRADTTQPADCETRPSAAPGEQGTYTSYVAAYPPYAYVLPALAMRAAGDHDPAAAYRIGRGVIALVSLVLLGLSLLLLWDGRAGPLSLAGAMVATTPMSVWSFSVLNTSGLEIAGATCWTAALLRLSRPARAPAWVWAAAAAGGVVLATTRPSGPVFVVFSTLCVALMFGLSPALRIVRRADRAAVLASVAVGAGLAAALFWQRYMPGYSLGVGRLIDCVPYAIEDLPRVFREAVGRFAGDWFVPVYVALAWAALLGALVTAAAMVVPPRQRRRVLLLAGGTIAFIAAYATAYLTSGFDEFYGRYALPGLVVLPLCAGRLLAERASELAATTRARLVVALTLGTAAIQLLAWWLESRRLAVGTDGPLVFPSDAGWDPPGGWLLWIAVMLAGVLLYGSVAWQAAYSRSPRASKARALSQ